MRAWNKALAQATAGAFLRAVEGKETAQTARVRVSLELHRMNYVEEVRRDG